MAHRNPGFHADLTTGITVAREEKTVISMQKSEAFMRIVYIASPFAGDTERNITKAQGYCRFAVSNGCMPIAPHLHYPQFMDDSDTKQREIGIRFALALLGKCDELWAFGDSISEGMKCEIAKANQLGMPVRYFNSKCEEITEC